MSKEFFYRGKSNARKEGIVRWFTEEDVRSSTIRTLETYLTTGIIREFENHIINDVRGTFSYIASEGESEDFALRLIRKLNVTIERRERTIPERRYGTSKGERVQIARFDKIKLKSGKVVFRARDNQGRFVKL